MDKQTIKSILKIVDKKCFLPILSKIHYCKKRNSRFASDTYILLRVDNSSMNNLESSFTIPYDAFKMISWIWKSIIGMKQNGKILEIVFDNWEKKEIIVDIEDKEFPDIEILKKPQSSIDEFENKKSLSKFFELSYNLSIEKTEVRWDVFCSKNREMELYCKIRK